MNQKNVTKDNTAAEKDKEKRGGLHRIYAILSKNKDTPFPENVREEHLDIPFLDHTGVRREAGCRLYLPASEHPLPLVYFSYYKITKDSAELARYLNEGWAVASPFEEKDHNTELTRDALAANSALLYALRRRPEIDADRIAITGGSAGGYMAMMLSALHLFPCCTVANGAPANAYFNFRHYAPYVSSFNAPAAAALKEEGRADLMSLLTRLPIPFGIVFNTFHTPENDARFDDLRTAAAVTPSLLADCFSNPLMEVHNTSDILVPVDQITRSFTYKHVSSDLPGDYRIHLSDYPLPEGFDRSFAEQLPEGSYSERLLPLIPEGSVAELPFDDKTFQINIFDEGEPQSHGSHGSDIPKGHTSDLAYIRHHFALGNADNFLTDGKLRLLLERYAGNSIQLPAHGSDGSAGQDTAVYGSAALYREETAEQLLTYRMRHPKEDLFGRMRHLAEEVPALAQAVSSCMEEICRMEQHLRH
ncbi:hypothetical protein B5F07_09090 [Lachnoclostridium sp. An169]|uniref:alpha/beta hydrolase family protein n=1 Tax=Lachnoclostridium sp. An169 TaxID=1965569 RepID=UPI000B3AAFF3|nr:prolyl oligopeptidase family serine peptidase [Lachnoclostridium sp. An169]OUP83997.1 hypothetical protein B5F07_09090 [Lachnoclostridium sp. An169]